MTTDYRIGLSIGTLATLSGLSVTDPDPLPVHYAKREELGDGTIRGVGYLMAEWRWARLYTSELNVLRTYCPGESASVYIKTLNRNGGWQGFSATMIMPEVEPAYRADVYDDFVVIFTELIEVGT